MNKEIKFEHFISLGFFCSVALELERLGLRSESSPFDWLISDFQGVLSLIQNQFDRFLDYELLVQDTSNRSYYKNIKYNIWFYHDFDKYKTLSSQLYRVCQKYNRRIQRFYENIETPTLFVRYIEGRAELEWIEKNYSKIIDQLRRFNPYNDIIYIANDDLISDIINIYYVEKDSGDTVARMFANKNAELKYYFDTISYPDRNRNIQLYKKKQKRKENPISKRVKKIIANYKEHYWKEYVHDKCI